MTRSVLFRWLGTAGLELRANGQVLVIDPYLTRFPLRYVYLGRIQPDRELIAESVEQCDHVLVTHPHFDHLMDVPDVVHSTDAIALASSHGCRLLAACGVPDHKLQEINFGDKLRLLNLQVEVLPAKHIWIPGFMYGPLPSELRPRLRARDYRMDQFFCFRVSVNGIRLLTDPGVRPEDGVAADVLFTHPFRRGRYYESLLEQVRPRLVVPYHWDDFFRPLSEPLRPLFGPLQWARPPIQRGNLEGFRRLIQRIAPDTPVFVPDIFQTYDLGKMA